MAKKKKHYKKTSRRRRVSGIGNAGVQLVLGVALGSVVAPMGVAAARKAAPTLKDNMLAGGLIGIGGLVALKMKNPLIQGMGLGFVSSGALSFGKSFNIISGIGDPSNLVTFTRNPQLNGVADNVIAGYGDDMSDGEGLGDMTVLAGVM